MSLLTKASTVTTPTAYDGGVLNSVKPVSRENLLLQSNQFDTTWVSNTTETGGQSGYDGSSDAWLLSKSAAGANLRQSISSSGVHSFSIYAKAGSLNWVALQLSGGVSPYVYFDLSTGNIGTQSNNIDAIATSIGSGWYRISIVASNPVNAVYIYPADGNDDLSGTSGNIYIQDAQLQKGITTTQYVETTTAALENGDFSFARASSATRVNEQGYIEKERENLYTQSNNFSHSDWTPQAGTFTQGVSDPNGGTDAWIWEATNTDPFLYQNKSLSGVYALSIYVKGVGSTIGDNIQIRVGGALKDVVLTNDWQRVEHFGVLSGATNIGFEYGNPATAGDIVHIYAAQLEAGLVATDYIETTTSSVAVGITNDIPRINYEGGIGNFLLEPQRTNELAHSEYIGAFGASNVSVTSNTEISPQGVRNAATIEVTTQTAVEGIAQGFVADGSSLYTISAYYKKTLSSTRAQLKIRDLLGSGTTYGFVDFNLSNGNVSASIGTYSITSFNDDWWYVVVTTSSAPSAGIRRAIVRLDNQPVGTEVSVFGFQVEAGSYPTSYIPTFGAAVTRAAETCNNAGNSDLFNDSEGVLYAEIAALSDDGTNRQTSISDNSTSDRIMINLHATSNQIQGYIMSGSSEQADMRYTANDATVFNKIAVKYKLNDCALWVNGVEAATDTSAATPVGLSELAFDNGGGSNPFYGKTKMVSTFTEALSDSELECLTSWSSFERMATAQNYNIQ